MRILKKYNLKILNTNIFKDLFLIKPMTNKFPRQVSEQESPYDACKRRINNRKKRLPEIIKNKQTHKLMKIWEINLPIPELEKSHVIAPTPPSAVLYYLIRESPENHEELFNQIYNEDTERQVHKLFVKYKGMIGI